jgi:hypothetical protein
MAISTYTELQAAVADWLNRDDLTAMIPDLVTLAESTLNRVMRNTRMITTGTLTATTASVAVPTDMLEPVLLEITSTGIPLEQIDVNQLVMLRKHRTRTAGSPKFYAILGRNVALAPTPSGSTGLTMTYYQSIPALASNSTNWLLTYNPDLYLYTCLMHAAPFLKDDARVTVFNNMLTQQIQAAIAQNTTATFDLGKTPGFSLDTPADPPQKMGVGG